MMRSEIKIYNLRIVPPKPVFDEICQFKKQFEAVFGKQKLSRSRPHITIGAFKMSLQYQDILLKAMDQLSSINKFELHINGFDIFDNKSNVLYLKVLKTKEVEQIYEQLKILWIRDLHRKIATLKMPSKLHITISKTEEKSMLNQSLMLFKNIQYFKQFKVDHLTLTSRYEFKTWDWEHHIQLSEELN